MENESIKNVFFAELNSNVFKLNYSQKLPFKRESYEYK